MYATMLCIHGWRRLTISAPRQRCLLRTAVPMSASPGTLDSAALNAASLDAPTDSLPKRSVALNIYVDAEVRDHLGMRNSDRKARVFLPAEYISNLERATPPRHASLRALKDIVERKFGALVGKPYVLRYSVPGGAAGMEHKRQFREDVEVHTALRLVTLHPALPSVQLYIDPLPGVFPPPSEAYLAGMPDPDESESYTLLSFYRFFTIDDPQDMAARLEALWKPFRAVGRIYVAAEGVNAQMAVPSNVLPNFKAACDQLGLLRDLYLNCDHTLSRAEFLASKPFKALHVRVRDQIVADGLSRPLDWHKSGREVDPMEWHAQLDNPASVILDCRNSYESDVGLFQGANPLNTTFFRESWDALEETLKDTPKDAPIMTYCTGGIRCVKINAYLEQTMGFTNVARLQGGIISYSRELEKAQREAGAGAGQLGAEGAEEGGVEVVEGGKKTTKEEEGGLELKPVPQAGLTEGAGVHEAQGLSRHHLARNVAESKFKGTNYVFDERMGARITDDVLSLCETCGAKCDLFTNCASFACHVRFIQCALCRAGYTGCCSVYCQQERAATEGQDEGNEQLGGGSSGGSSSSRAPLSTKGSRAMTPRVKPGRPLRQPQEAGSAEGKAEELAEAEKGDLTVQGAQTRIIDATFAALDPLAPAVPPPREHASSMDAQLDALQTYCERHSAAEPPLLHTLRSETKAVFGTHARMISGHLQGRLLAMLAGLMRAESVLELGAFTGYSALCFAEGMAEGRGGEGGAGGGGGAGGAESKAPLAPRVLSCEIDEQALAIARKFIAQSPHGSAIDLRAIKAAELIAQARHEGLRFDLVFIDADKKAYTGYLLDILGQGLHGGACLLNDGALVLVDNTLWKGLVLGQEADLKALAPEARLYGNADRMLALAAVMHEFNAFVAGHGSLSPVVLPLRDGLSVIRYRQEAQT